MKSRLPCHYAHITLGCGEYEHRVQNHYKNSFLQKQQESPTCKVQFKASTKEVCFILPTEEENRTLFYMSFLFYVSQYL
jgi:hypothetical protein